MKILEHNESHAKNKITIIEFVCAFKRVPMEKFLRFYANLINWVYKMLNWVNETSKKKIAPNLSQMAWKLKLNCWIQKKIRNFAKKHCRKITKLQTTLHKLLKWKFSFVIYVHIYKFDTQCIAKKNKHLISNHRVEEKKRLIECIISYKSS